MKPYFLYPVLIYFAFGNISANAQEYKTDWGKYNLKGKVKVMRERLYDSVDADWNLRKPAPEDEEISVYKFDSSGNLTSEVIGLGGLPKREWFYKYAGLRLVETDSYSRFDSVGVKFALKLDDKTMYSYDGSGNKIEEDAYNQEEEIIVKHRYSYNKEGKKTYEDIEDGHGNLYTDFRFQYDSKGHLIEESSEDHCNGCMHSMKTKDKYDSKGNCTESEEYNSKFAAKYKDKLVFKYDSLGNFTETLVYDSADKLIKINTEQYIFDEKGNWTEKRQSIDSGKSKNLKTRSFEYY